MSSGPVGLDCREYGYGVFGFTAPDGNQVQVTTGRRWLITKIQAYLPEGVAGQCGPEGQQVVIDAGGCLVLEPNGAYRGDVYFQGNGGRLIVEYWFQGVPGGITPNPTVV